MPPALRPPPEGPTGSSPASFTRRMRAHRPEDCFDQQRVTNGVAEARDGFNIVDFHGRSNGHAGRQRNFSCAALVTDSSQRLCRGPAKAIFSISSNSANSGCSLKNP